MFHILAVAACKAILAFLFTVTSTVAYLLTVDTLDSEFFPLDSLLRTGLRNMTKLCTNVSDNHLAWLKGQTIAVGAFGNATLDGNTGIFEARHIFFWGRWPTSLQRNARWFIAEEEPNMIFAVELAAKIHQGVRIGNFFLLNKVRVSSYTNSYFCNVAQLTCAIM